jgi:Kef-type K+ transport system membrane component KefB
MTTLGTLALIVACGLAGPLLAGASGNVVPLVVGEIGAGVIFGVSGLGAIDPTQPTLVLLGDVGFATLMFTVGMHLPIADPRLRSALGHGARAAALGIVVAIPAGLGAAAIAGTSHAALFAVILASSSAAVALPILSEHGLTSGSMLPLVAQITVADVVAVIAVPFALEPDRAGSVLLGSLAVVAATLAFFVALRLLWRVGFYRRMRASSKERGWALDLQIAIAALLGLAWLAVETGTSILIAGFGAGIVVAAIGGPERLSLEVRGVAQGFLVPLFFVLLGARLNVRALFTDPSNLAIAASLFVLNLAVHVAAARATRQRAAAGLVATAQLGVPAAVVALGLAKGILNPGQGAAVIVAALASVGACAAGAALLARRPAATSRRDPVAAGPQPSSNATSSS